VSLALARGITFFDTADAYGRGLSERIVGKVIADRRDQVVVATKCGLVKTPTSVMRAVNGSRTERDVRSPRGLADATREILSSRRCYAPDYVTRSAEASLRRLKSDYIDIFLLHSPPAEILRAGQFVDAMHRLEASGKIRAWGASVYLCDDALLALELPGISAIEIRLNLCDTEALARVIPEAVRRGVGVIARQPLGSGEIEQKRRALSVAPGAEDAPVEFSPKEILAGALHFSLSTEGVATTIVGMTQPEHVAANVAIATDERIASDDVKRIQHALCEAE
jgi:aryl-alcohol dehydrogenase-like predicted oxidoreductase